MATRKTATRKTAAKKTTAKKTAAKKTTAKKTTAKKPSTEALENFPATNEQLEGLPGQPSPEPAPRKAPHELPLTQAEMYFTVGSLPTALLSPVRHAGRLTHIILSDLSAYWRPIALSVAGRPFRLLHDAGWGGRLESGEMVGQPKCQYAARRYALEAGDSPPHISGSDELRIRCIPVASSSGGAPKRVGMFATLVLKKGK